jgi:hypothetical protein
MYIVVHVGGTASGFYTVEDDVSLSICVYTATMESNYKQFFLFSVGRFHPSVHAVWSEAALPKPSKLSTYC